MHRPFVLLIALFACCVALPARADSTEEAQEEMRKAKAAMDRREYEAAIGHYLVARSLSPDSSGPYLGLGLAQAALGRCNEAIPVLEEYLRRKPQNPHPSAVATLAACQGRSQTLAWGRLQVVSQPAGADVRVDDEEDQTRGRTPLSLSLPPGPHRLTISSPGYREELRTVEVVSGRTVTVSVPLRAEAVAPPPTVLVPVTPPSRGRIHVEIGPLAATVTVNGVRESGERRDFEVPVPAGIYQVVIERPGYDTITHELWVRGGETTHDKVTLVASGPREAKRKAGIALGIIFAAGVAATAIAVGVVYGTPAPPTTFSTVVNP